MDPISPRGNTPSAIPAGLADIHAPSISSPLNPSAKPTPKPVQREQREKKETLKKREGASGRGATPDAKGKKSKGPSVPSPMRYSIPAPKLSDYEPPRDTIFRGQENRELYLTPDRHTELKKIQEHAANTKVYRYSPCVADPLFHHKQYYRSSEARPHGSHMSIEDTDRQFTFDDSATIVMHEKGWRTSRANVFAREGSLYYEVKILNGMPADSAAEASAQDSKLPQPHIRMGWARREAPLDAPVGFDGYSYGIVDTRFSTVHRSRPGKISLPQPKSKSKSKAKPTEPVATYDNDNMRTGDVIGLLITLPSLSLHQKVIEGIYNPAVDKSDGFDDPPGPAADIIRDRIPVPFKGNIYFEQHEYQSTKPMDGYSDRGPYNKVTPHPNHEDVALRSLPGSEIRVYKNGQLIGTAFEKLLAFLPPASLVPPGQGQGARSGFDDGSLGYYPVVSSFHGGTAQVNFGPDFWFPPADLGLDKKDGEDTAMGGASQDRDEVAQKRKVRGIGDRWKEQVAEDVVWDIIDEVDFYSQDGGPSYVPEEVAGGASGAAPTARGMSGRDE